MYCVMQVNSLYMLTPWSAVWTLSKKVMKSFVYRDHSLRPEKYPTCSKEKRYAYNALASYIKLSICCSPGLYLQFYRFSTIFITLGIITIQWITIFAFRSMGPGHLNLAISGGYNWNNFMDKLDKLYLTSVTEIPVIQTKGDIIA